MIDQKKFFTICDIVGVTTVSNRLSVRNTAVYNWIYDDAIPPIRWVEVQKFMDEFESKNAVLLSRRMKEYEVAMSKGKKFVSKTKRTYTKKSNS